MELDVNIIIGFLGTLVTIVSLYFAFKFRTKPRLVYLINSLVAPIRIVKNISDIQIQYKNKPITENLFLLNVTFINAGNKDIDKSDVHKNLSVILPDYFNWLNCNIINKSKDLNVSITNDANISSFAWDLLKPKESFTIEGLIEYSGESISNDRKKLNRLTFDYRIKDINTIETIEKSKLMNFPTFIFLFILFLVIGLLGYKLTQDYYIPQNKAKILLVLKDKSVREINGLYFDSFKNNIIVKDDKKNDLDTLQSIDSTAAISIKAISAKVESSLIKGIFGLVLLIIFLVGLFMVIKQYLNDIAIRRILKTGIKDGELP